MFFHLSLACLDDLGHGLLDIICINCTTELQWLLLRLHSNSRGIKDIQPGKEWNFVTSAEPDRNPPITLAELQQKFSFCEDLEKKTGTPMIAA